MKAIGVAIMVDKTTKDGMATKVEALGIKFTAEGLPHAVIHIEQHFPLEVAEAAAGDLSSNTSLDLAFLATQLRLMGITTLVLAGTSTEDQAVGPYEQSLTGWRLLSV